MMPTSGNLNEATLGPRRHRAVLDWANEFGGMYHLRFVWVNVRPSYRDAAVLPPRRSLSPANSVCRVTWWCVTVQLMVISDPAIAAEVVHSREFDKVEEAYRSVTKAWQTSVLALALHMLSEHHFLRLHKRGPALYR